MESRKYLTPEEYKWISFLKATIDSAWDELNDFEKKFIEDIIERFNKYSMKTIITKKQWDILTRISEKIT